MKKGQSRRDFKWSIRGIRVEWILGGRLSGSSFYLSRFSAGGNLDFRSLPAKGARRHAIPMQNVGGIDRKTAKSAAWSYREACESAKISRSTVTTEGSKRVKATLKTIRAMLTDAGLPPEVEHAVLWRFDQLPALYMSLKSSYESRYSDRILLLVQGILKTLASEEAGGAEALKLAEKIVARLQKMHDAHGLAEIGLKPPTAPKPKPVRKKKAG
jgi:hypothetical protein